MKAKEIIRLFRRDVDDETQPYFFSDDEALELLNEAQLEACRRSRLLVDSTNADLTRIALVPGTHTYALDPRVLFIRKAFMSTKPPMRRMNQQDMAAYDPYWENASESPEPSVFLTDCDTGKVRFWPTPSTAGTVVLLVVRDPLEELNSAEDTPEINARYHRALRHWMVYAGLMKPDAQVYDPKKAGIALQAFEAEFGKKSSAIEENWIAREQMEGDGTF